MSDSDAALRFYPWVRRGAAAQVTAADAAAAPVDRGRRICHTRLLLGATSGIFARMVGDGEAQRARSANRGDVRLPMKRMPRISMRASRLAIGSSGFGRWWVALLVAVPVAALWSGCRPPALAPLPNVGTCSAPMDGPPLGAWSPGPAAQKRRADGLMLALSGGRVLFAGGRAGGKDSPCGTDVELFEPATMTWRSLAPLPEPMCSGVGVELASGRVLVGIQVPGPSSDWRRGSAIFVVYEPSNNQWTEVARAAAPFNLQRVVVLRGDEVFVLGFDKDSLVVAYTWSPAGLAKAVAPPRTPHYGLMTVVAAQDRSITWFLDDTSVMKSAAPDAAAVPFTDARPRGSISYVVDLPDHQVMAKSGEGWLIWDQHEGTWRDIDLPPHLDHNGGLRAASLGDDRVLIARPGRSETSASLFTASTGHWERIASPHEVDRLFAALLDGRIIALDETGRTTIWSADATMDLAWRRLAAVPVLLRGASVTPLADGRLLVAGGNVGDYRTSQRAIVVDPVTGAWAETGSMSTPRMNHTATLLPDGRVLVAGGSDQTRIVRTSYWFSTKEPGSSDYDEGVYNLDTLEVWDPTTGGWSSAGRLPVPLTEHAAASLADGRVALVGGYARRRVPQRLANDNWKVAYATWKFGGVLIWDPATRRVVDVNATPRRDSVGVLALRDGRVLALGGVPEGYEPKPLDLIQALDPQDNSFATVGTLRVPRATPLAVQLADGTVLVTGGFPPIEGTTRRIGLPIERWDPVTNGPASALPEFDLPRAPQAARVLPDGRAAIAACDRTILWDPATSTWGRTDDLPAGSSGCRILVRKQTLMAITSEGCTYELGGAAP